MMAKRRVAREARSRALVAAVHRYQVDVHVHREIAFHSASVELDFFAVLGCAEMSHAIGVFGVVVVEAAARCEGVVDAVADRVAQFVLGHPSM